MHVTPRPGHVTLHTTPLWWIRYDFSGRWNAAIVEGATYRRGLSGRVVAMRHVVIGAERFHDVDEVPDADGLHERFRQQAERALPSVDARWRPVIERAAAADAAALGADAVRYKALYGEHVDLPPDEMTALVVPPAAPHAVAAYMGPSLAGCRGMFVQHARAIPTDALVARAGELRDRLGSLLQPEDALRPPGAWHPPSASLSAWDDPEREGWPQLRAAGFHRVYLRRGQDDERLLKAVSDIRRAGLHATVELACGVAEHVADSRRLLLALDLSSDDGVILSESFDTAETRLVVREQARALILDPAFQGGPRFQMYDPRQILH